MKAFLISDTHFGTHILDVDEWLNMMKDYFYSFFIPLLEEKVEDGDILIHLGDLFDNRSQIPIHVLNAVDEILVRISEILPIHIIVGNHDIYNKNTNEINSPKTFRWIPNVHVYEETTLIEYNDKKLVLMPWVNTKKEQINKLKEYSGSDYLFCHSDLNGCRMHLSSVAWKNKNKIDVEEFASYKAVYSGHIHIRQENKNFKFIGSPYHLDRNDYGDKKGVYILNIDSGEEEFIENNVSPEYKRLKILKSEDLEKLENVDCTKNYIDLYLSNNLLINDRKVRRRVEGILEKKKFAKIEYVNDLKSKEVGEKIEESIKQSIESEEFDLDNMNFDDMDKTIRKYIETITWSDEKVKDGVLEEFENISNIFKNQN